MKSDAEIAEYFARKAARELAMDRMVAHKLRADPALLRIGAETLDRWERNGARQEHPMFRAWRGILVAGLDATCAVLTSEDEHSVELRRAHPFPGVLEESERINIFP